jgi:penicillin-binding protein 1C
MSELQRPDIYGQWQSFSTSRQIAWKTGTSFGLKDAWAVGVTPDHFIGIWIGNASNEGRPDLIGSRVAAPLLFELFDLLPPSGWFEKPGTTMEIVTCTRSGYLAGPHCEQLTIWAHPHAERAPSCPYHSKIFVDEAGIYRVHKGCFPAEPIEKIQFVLPPVETYYRRHYTQIESPLPWHPQCSEENVTPEMELIYPVGGTSLVIPVELSGEKGMGVFKCAHRREKSSINWYVDGHFLGKTTSFHEMAIQLEPGSYLLTLVDDNGSRISQKFSVVSRT